MKQTNLVTETVNFLNRGLEEGPLATPAFNDLAYELMGYVDEDERVIKKLHKPLVKKLSKDFDAGKYNHGKATKEWAAVIEKALNMNKSMKKQVLSQTMSGKKVGEALIEYVAKMLAKEYKDELEAAKKNGSDVMDMFS